MAAAAIAFYHAGVGRADNSLSLNYLEGMLSDYLRDPASVPEDWREYLQRLARSNGQPGTPARHPPAPAPPASAGRAHPPVRTRTRPADHATASQHRVDQLIRNYRVRGHMIARLDPLDLPRPEPAELSLQFNGLSEADLDETFTTDALDGDESLTLRQILERMRNTYCRSIGAQFMHIDDLAVRRWLQTRMEGTENHLSLAQEQRLRILKRLTDAAVFEQVVQRKYIGAKSFSLEGAETLIPLLELAFEKASAHGLGEIVLGMAHRGRLNVLTNIMGKPAAEIFREFEDASPRENLGAGDVKYHLGYSSDWRSAAGDKLHLSLCFNPSHLEFINPVALGRMRAKQDRAGDADRRLGMVLLIHGDASFAGEGVVQETLNLSELAGYSVGGALHVIVNNQLGFTTPPEEGRSSVYATDVAKMLQSPIFHVNGEDPEAVAQVVHLAMDFRKQFKQDVFIDLYCYRRRGHNEGDEPAFTQPLFYKAIRHRPPVREVYLERLEQLGSAPLMRQRAREFVEQKTQELDRSYEQVQRQSVEPCNDHKGRGIWAGYCGGSEARAPEADTGVERERLLALLNRLNQLPDHFQPHRKIERWLKTRREMAGGDRPIDWAAAEALALASIAAEGLRVRLTGQDTARGTFSQRHAVLHDVKTGNTYTPLQNLVPDQAPVEIINSPLSEAGALGFEYGYSLDCPDGLIAWEAQFGDFFNAGQVIIDQFITSAEDKWGRLSGIVMLLPHGFEGQGPEHSSARLERWLVLAAEDNIQVVYPTTPAQYFHVLRRQVLRPLRKPLVVLTPKSLLRHSDVVSPIDDLAEGRFRRVLQDDMDDREGHVERVLLCSGKIYYELRKRREELERQDVAILRLEQLYPLPLEQLRAALAPFADGTTLVWVQEEPRNMGAWPYLRAHLGHRLFDRLPLQGIYREESASPATGSSASHKLEQEHLIDQAFGGV